MNSTVTVHFNWNESLEQRSENKVHATIGILESWEKLPNRGYTLELVLNQF
jgi:hypothetical protein